MEQNASRYTLSREVRSVPAFPPKLQSGVEREESLARVKRPAAEAAGHVPGSRSGHRRGSLPVPPDDSSLPEEEAKATAASRERAGAIRPVTGVGPLRGGSQASSRHREEDVLRLRQAVLQSRATLASRWRTPGGAGRMVVERGLQMPPQPSYIAEGPRSPLVCEVSENEKSRESLSQLSSDSPPKKAVPEMPLTAGQAGSKQPLVLKVKKKQPFAGKKGVLKRTAFPGGPRQHASPSGLQDSVSDGPAVKSGSGAMDHEPKASSGVLFSSRPSFLLRFPSVLSDGDAEDLNLTASGFLSNTYSSLETPGRSLDALSSPSSRNASSSGSFTMFRTLPKLPVQPQREGIPSEPEGQAPSLPDFPAQRPSGKLSSGPRGQAPVQSQRPLQPRSELLSPGQQPQTATGATPLVSSLNQRTERRAEGEKTALRLAKTVSSLPPARSQEVPERGVSSHALSRTLKEQTAHNSFADDSGERGRSTSGMDSEAAEDKFLPAEAGVDSKGSGVDVSAKFGMQADTTRAKESPKTAALKKKQKKTRFVSDALEPVPGVEPRVEELAAEEDFDRQTAAYVDVAGFDDRHKRLSPAVARLRQERLELARWVQRLREGRGDPGAQGMRPEVFSKPSAPGAPEVPLAANYLLDDFEPPLKVPLEPQGQGMEEILAKEAQMPSTAVWQLEQIKKANHLRLAQQQRHIGLLQKALRKAEREARKASKRAEGDGDTSTDDSGSVISPREAERAILQEQCATLLERIHLEADSKDAYRRAVFAIQGQKERTMEKYRALRDRLNAAHTVTRVEQAKREEEQENVEDLRDRLDRKAEMLKRVTSTSEQYEFQLLKLQQRYEELTRYLLESQEKVSSYQEGLREARSNFEHEVALLQIEKDKTSRLSQRVKEQEKFMGRMEISLRLERDKVLSREKTIQDLREALEEKDQLLLEARDEVQQERERLTAEQRVHEHTRVQVANLKQESVNKAKDLEFLRVQKSIAAEQGEAIERLAEDFRLLLGSSREQSAVLEEVLDEVEHRRQKALQLLHRALQSMDTAADKRTTGTGEADQAKADTVAALQKIEADQSNELKGLRSMRDRLQKENEEQRTVMARLADENRRIVAEASELQDRLATSTEREADLLRDLGSLSSRIRHLTDRAISLFPAQGRTGSDSVVREISQMQKGATFEKCHLVKKKTTMKFIRLNKALQIVWTADQLGPKGRKVAKAINLSDIVSVEFGTQSAACRMRMETARARKQEILPWRCFAIHTAEISYLFIAPDDEVAAAWVIGLGRLVAASSTAPNIRSRRELCLKRAKMKLAYYCQQKGITQVKMWKDALATATGSRPHSHGIRPANYQKAGAQHSSPSAVMSTGPRQSSTSEPGGRRTIFRMTTAEKKTLMGMEGAKQAQEEQPE